VVDIRLGSTEIVRYFLKMGLVHNKTDSQVDMPKWINSRKDYQSAFLRGLFDTDGSIYKLKFGVQICYKNASIPLLESTRKILLCLNYKPSQISYRSLYLTRKEDLRRFFKEIRPANQKHISRARLFKLI
jgi:DNA-binding transcriptional regulator WhiA